MRILLFTFIFSAFIFSSCEDDPIVEPSNSGGGSPGGSYARLSFPDSTQLNKVNP